MSSDTRIHTLRIAAAANCRAAVASALEHIDWSLAAADEILILRRIHVGGPLPEIGRLAQQQAQQSAAHAVDGWHANAEQAEAVRFKNRADLLACLLRDLVSRRQCWFWRGWQDLFRLQAGAAIAQAMEAEALRWPAVMQLLASQNAAVAIWRALTPDDAQNLLQTLARATGWNLRDDRTGTHEDLRFSEAGSVPDGETGLRFGNDVQDISAATQISLQAWPAWLQAVIAESGDQPVLQRLALVTWLWRDAPQILSAANAASRISRIQQTMQRVNSIVANPEQVAVAVGPDGSTPHSSFAHSSFAHSTFANMPDPQLPASAALIIPAETQPAHYFGQAASNRAQTGHPASESRLPSPTAETRAGTSAEVELQPMPVATSDSLHISRCYTSQGGWLLLLNALNQPNVLSRLQTLDTPAEPTSGWIWLYRIGLALGGQADAALTRFLTEAAGFANTSVLESQPPLPDEIGLTRLVQARYGEVVCDGALFQMPALLLANQSHLDVHYRMQDIRLDVRRVALDINPGWLPWLGRVVNFHYGQAPELMRTDAP